MIFWGCSRRARELIFYEAEYFSDPVLMSPFSRLPRLFEIPRSLEAIQGRGQIWHPETRGSHLSTIYGGSKWSEAVRGCTDYYNCWILIANAIWGPSNCHLSSQVSNWKSIATFYKKKLWVIRKKYPQDYVRRSQSKCGLQSDLGRPRMTSMVQNEKFTYIFICWDPILCKMYWKNEQKCKFQVQKLSN